MVFGLLTSLGKREIDEVMQVAEGYFYGSGDMQKQAPIFLSGLFAGAKDIFLYNESLLSGMSHVLEELDEEVFLQVLPHLRLYSVNSRRLKWIRLLGIFPSYMVIQKKR